MQINSHLSADVVGRGIVDPVNEAERTLCVHELSGVGDSHVDNTVSVVLLFRYQLSCPQLFHSKVALAGKFFGMVCDSAFFFRLGVDVYKFRVLLITYLSSDPRLPLARDETIAVGVPPFQMGLSSESC
jgi:hypothetical protein